MAKANPSKKKPRIRKEAPTIRELAEASQAASDSPPSRGTRARRSTTKLLGPLGPIWLVLRKVLGWLAPRYFVNSWREVRQVTWPNRRETWRLTLAVFIFAVVFGIIVYFVDKGLEKIFKEFVLK